MNNINSVKHFKIAFIGFPNAGKTSLFNELNKTNHHVGNWCGVTVAQHSAHSLFLEIPNICVDLPGIEKLDFLNFEQSLDTRLTQNFLQNEDIDCVLNVIDATNLQKELCLTLDLLKKGFKLIVVLNMMDLSKKQGQCIDHLALSKALGCPIIPMSAIETQNEIKNQNLNTLKKEIIQLYNEGKFHNEQKFNNDKKILDIQKECQNKTSQNLLLEAEILSKKVIKKPFKNPINWTQKIDNIVLNKYFGIPILLAFMYLAFGFTIHIGGGIQNLIEQHLHTFFILWPESILTNLNASLLIKNLWVQGIGTGIVTTLCFVPVIAGMYFCISLLETSGYMTRAAYVMDSLMQRIGLSGKSFIPMILGFGCNVPAILATRTLENQKQRILTILMSPFMSCGARLAIYALFVTAFFKEGGHNIIFSLYCIGILMAIFTGWLFKKTLFSGSSESECTIHLTDYRWPSFIMLFRTTVHRTLRFVIKAGMIILPLCACIGLLCSFPLENNETLLTYLGHLLTPCLSPMGIQSDNWPATVGLLTGVMAKEVVVGTLNSLYAGYSGYSGANALGSMVQHFGSLKAAFAYLLFVLLYFPCVSVFATIAKELSFTWAVFTAFWTTSLAYLVSVLFYQLSMINHQPQTSLKWIIIIMIWSGIMWFLLKWMGQRSFNKKSLKPLPTQVLVLDN